MEEILQHALELRASGNLQESSRLLVNLAASVPDDAFIQYQCAASFDMLGEESSAVPFYQKAIELGLEDEHLEGAYLGLGSTFRTLGEYEQSKEVFEKGLERFPNHHGLRVFYAMTCYNLHEHAFAMELLLNSLIETTDNSDILKYKRAIAFYSDKLDRVWR